MMPAIPMEIEGGQDYVARLLSSISPLVTVDAEFQVQYVNDPFHEAFAHETEKARQDFIGRDLFEVMPVETCDREALSHAVRAARDHKVQNREFRARGRVFGYSVFRFEEVAALVLKDITDLRRLEGKVADLSTRLLNVQEQERRRVFAALHDSVGQTILAAKLNLSSYMQDPEASLERFERGLHLIDKASQELREIYTGLYPPELENLGLEASVRGIVRNFLSLKNIQTQLNLRPPPNLSYALELNIFRIIQELFTNIVKHSDANMVDVSLEQLDDETLELVVQDNGNGFDVGAASRADGLGLENIRLRVQELHGNLRMESDRKGSRFSMRLPLSYKEYST